MTIINVYLIIINIISFITMGIDKFLAIKKKNRISEFHILILSLFGGSIGTLLGMISYKHKTRKTKLLVLVPIFLILHIIIYINA